MKGSRRRRLVLASAVFALALAVAVPSLANARSGGLLGSLGLTGGSDGSQATSQSLGLPSLGGLLDGAGGQLGGLLGDDVDELLGEVAGLGHDVDEGLRDLLDEASVVYDELDAEKRAVLDEALKNVDDLGGQAIGGLTGLLAETGLLGVLSDLLCPVVSELAALSEPLPIAGDVVGLLEALICNLGNLEYQFLTVWEGPDGQQIQRLHHAIIGVPTPMNVDNAPGTDLVGTIGFGLSFDRFTLTIDRASGSTDELPVSVEAIITDPTGGTFQSDRVAFGYDQRDDTAPGGFETEFGIGSGGDDPQLEVAISQQDPGETTTVIGSLFDGGPVNRTDQTAARIGYENSPTLATLGISLDDPVELALTTDVTGPASAELVDRSGEGDFGAEIAIDELPNQLTFTLDSEQNRVVYDASAPVDTLAAEVQTEDPLFLDATHIDAVFSGVPEQFELGLGGEGDEIELSSTEPIGQIDLRARSEDREFPVIPDGEVGAILDATNDELALALRVLELRRLGFTLEPIALEAAMQGGQVFTVEARLEGEDGLTEADIVLDPIPSELAFSVDSESGTVSYEGSDTMDRLAAAVSTTEPLFLDASHLDAQFLDVPESFELTLGQEVENLTLSSDEPIGQIDLLARSEDREFPIIPDGESGAILDATGGELALALRVFELELLDVSLDPIGLVARMQGGRVFTADVQLDADADEADIESVLETLAELASEHENGEQPACPNGEGDNGNGNGDQENGAEANGEVVPLDEHENGDNGNGDNGNGDEPGAPDDPAEVIQITAVIDQLPSEIALGLSEIEPPACGTRLSLTASDQIDFLSLSVNGVELLEGADLIELEINDIPTEVAVELPEEGPLAAIEANDNIGQLRLSASDGSGELPERSILDGDPVLNDVFEFGSVPGEFAAALRLTAVESLSVNLDPVNIALEQDGGLTRAIDLAAALEAGDDVIDVDGLLDRPGDRTSLSVELEPDEPTRIIFDNSHNMDRFELRGSGIGGLGNVEANFDNIPTEMSICMDPGPACQRPNPHTLPVGGPHNNRPYPAEVSMDFDDFGSHGSGTGAAFRTTLNAEIELLDGDPVEIEDLRFRNLTMDFGQGPSFSGTCTVGQQVPRMYMFFDSRSHPWVMNSVKYPPLIQDFRIGTDSNPARAANRIAALVGCTGFLNTSLNRQQAGALACGGQSVLNTQLGFLGTVNILSIPLIGSAINLCGGTVPNPQPW